MTDTEHSQASSSGIRPDGGGAKPVSPSAAGIIIGLDIGGTKTRGVRFEDGVAVADQSAGSANVQNVTPEQAALAIALGAYAVVVGQAITRPDWITAQFVAALRSP